MATDPFPFDAKLKDALDAYRVPELSANFADRVLNSTEDRIAPLPTLRPSPKRRWQRGRRIAIGVMAAGAIATAAAATGVLEELGIELPAADEVWSAITFEEQPRPAPSPSQVAPKEASEDPVQIEGPIDTPEELEEVFRRVDDVRDTRREARRDRVDQRVDNAIERRVQRGLPTPSDEQEQRLRERIERFRESADTRREQRTEERRDELRETLEEEGTLSRDDIIRGEGPGRPAGDRIRRFRDLSPEERRERIRQFRERRGASRPPADQEQPTEVTEPIDDSQQPTQAEDPPSDSR
ncbi:MAG: hypothetical protein AAFY42_01155 [Pseudomonadota bacterium]